MIRCDECKYGCLKDHGYSNYTVEGTHFGCGNRYVNITPFDRFYNRATEFEELDNCPFFEKGKNICMDVEFENLKNLTPEENKIFQRAFL